MSTIVFLIEQIAHTNGPYVLCALVVLLQVRALVMVRRRLALAEYDLERELAIRQRTRAITLLLAAIEIALGIYAIANVVAPSVRQDKLPGGSVVVVADNAGNGESTPFQTLPPDAIGTFAAGSAVAPSDLAASFLTLTAQPPEGSNLKPLLTLPPSPTPPGTIEPGAPKPIGCTIDQTATPPVSTPSPDKAQLQIPANGQVVYESLTVVGKASTTQFSNYKFELSGPSTGNNFVPYGGDHQVPLATSGVLGQLSLAQFAAGTYLFRLAVFDNTSALKASCMVTIHLRPRPPTVTPSQTPPAQPTLTPAA